MKKKLKEKKINIKNVLLNLLLIISTVSFSFIFAITTKNGISTRKYVIITLIITFLLSLFMIKKDFIKKTIENSKKSEFALSGFLTVIYALFIKNSYNLKLASKIIYKTLTKFHLVTFTKYFTLIASLFFIFLGILFIIKHIGRYIIEFIKSFDKEEKKFYKIFTILFSVLIIVIYSQTDKFGFGYDKIFSMDSYYVSHKMIEDLFWALDIRHIIFAVIASPVKVITSIFTTLFPNTINLYYMIIALINVQLLIFIAIMLKRLTNNKWTAYLYLLLLPSLQFGLIVEKFPICTFLLVLFIYNKFYKQDRTVETFSLITTIGTATSNIFSGFLYGNGNFKERVFKWIKVALLFVGICALFGKTFMIIDCFKQLQSITGKYSVDYSILRKIYAVSELFYSFIFMPEYVLVKEKIAYGNTAEYMNWIGLVIFAVTIIGFILNHKDKFARICIYWTGVIFILFMGLNWSCHEAPLFNLNFSWAVIPLICMAIEKIKSKNLRQKVYIGIILLSFLINIPGFIDIFNIALTW